LLVAGIVFLTAGIFWLGRICLFADVFGYGRILIVDIGVAVIVRATEGDKRK
jgi:hypothetical protein